MTFHYLDFDYSEDADGTGTFDAMASVSHQQISALHAEIAELLTWAHTQFPDACGPQEDGGVWQYDLRGIEEVSKPLALEYDPDCARITCISGTPDAPRTTITLSVSGDSNFCASLRDAFGII